MARSSKGDTALLVIGTAIGVPIIVVGKLWQYAEDYPTAAIAIVAIILTGAYLLDRRRRKRRSIAASNAMKICQELTQEHIVVLTKRWRETVSIGAYGEVLKDEYDREVAYFMGTVVHPHIRDQLVLLGDPNLIGPSREVIISFIKAEVAKAIRATT